MFIVHVPKTKPMTSNDRKEYTHTDSKVITHVCFYFFQNREEDPWAKLLASWLGSEQTSPAHKSDMLLRRQNILFALFLCPSTEMNMNK
jgi:hypothetical protein